MLSLPLIAVCVVALFTSAGILESFSRGLQAAAFHNMYRPVQNPPQTTTEQTPVTDVANDWQMNSSSTYMPTLSGAQQRVDLCEGNILVPLSSVKKELTFKSTQFPFKRSVPLLCSWNVKVDNKCRRGRVTMVINERSRLSGDRRCTKGYYRVSPFMKEAKICGRINTVPAFQWYVEDQQPENVTITLKHNGLNDGYSEGLGECLTEASDMTTSKAIKYYSHWLHELSKSQSASTGALTVVLPFVTLDQMPLQADSAHLANASNSEPEAVIQPLQNVATVTPPLPDNNTTHQIANSSALQALSNQTVTVTVGVDKNATAPVQLTMNVTEMPIKVSQKTTGRPSLTNDRKAPSYAIDFKVPEDDSEIPWLIVESLKPIPSPLEMYPDILSRQPVTKRPAPATPVSHGDNHDIPWLILKSPDSSPSVPTTRPPTTKHSSPTLVPIRRPLPTTARPTTHRWPMRQSVQPSNRLSSFIRPHRPKGPVRPQVRPTTSIDHQGIPWLILKSPDPSIIDSFLLGLHSVSAATAINGQQQSSPQSIPADQTGNYNSTGYLHTNSSSVYVPTADGGHLRVDLCEGDIVVPLSFDVQKEMVIKSTSFPFKRSTPLVCSWNVRATTNCRRGLITMTINERSRLADVDGCRNGYYTVSPFMENAKICGRINTVPVFRWYVEHEQPENVTITLRHIGLDDGYSEGLSFNLSGDCLPNRDDTTISKAWQSYGNWLRQLSQMQLTTAGGPTVVLPSVSTTQSNFSNESTPILNAEDVVDTTIAPPLDTTTTTTQIPESSSPISSSLETSLQSNVSNTSTFPTVHPPRENVTSLLNSTLNSSDVLPSAQLTTQQPSHSPQITKGPVNLAPEDHDDIPWLILKPLGESLAQVHPTPSPRPSSTKRPTTVKPGVVVVPANILPNNIQPAKNVYNTEPEIPWLILKTPDRNQLSVELDSSKKRPSDQLDVVEEDPNPFYDYDENPDSSENGPALILDSDPDVDYSLQTPETDSSYFAGHDIDDHVQKVQTAGNAIPWLISKTRNPPSKHYLPFTRNAVTNVQLSPFNSRTPSMTWSLRKSAKKPLVHRVSADFVPIDAVDADQPKDSSDKSALDEPVVTMNPLHDTVPTPATKHAPIECLLGLNRPLHLYLFHFSRYYLNHKKKSPSKSITGHREWPSNSSSTVVPTADGGQLIVDMCEANIVIPLTSQRAAKRNFTVKSTQFPFKRSTPLICSWNVKVSKSCRRGLVTMSINERSRLAGDQGCLNGYYTVSPIMDDIKMCGRVNYIPALQWYVEDQQPEVTISLKHAGLNDGYSEGLAFTLSGECLSEESDMTQSKATKTYNHWLQQIAGQSLKFGVPTIALPDGLDLESIRDYSDSETDDTDELIDLSTTTMSPNVTDKKPPKKNGLDFDLETPWHLLKNQSAPTTTASPVSTSPKPQPPAVNTTNSEPHPIIHLTYQTLNQTIPLTTAPAPKKVLVPTKPPAKPAALTDLFNLETPWHVLKNQSLMATVPPPKKNSTTPSPAQTVELILESLIAHSLCIMEMRQPSLVQTLFILGFVFSFTSAGILQRIQQIPNPISSFLLGWKEANGTDTGDDESEVESALPPLLPSVLPNVTNYSHYKSEGLTVSSTVVVPTADGGHRNVDLCEGNILVPLSNDRNTLIEETFKSTKFPYERSTPLICSWNVRVSDNCRRGLVTMTINKRSRLAEVEGCTKGYYRVSPFMKEAKICGRIETVPAFQWYVEDQQPENVTISLRHVGLNDGYWEGLSFTLSGECLPNKSDLSISKAVKSYSNWLHQLSRESEALDLVVVTQ
ncbi:hypothetical protein GHT06_019939 [Daphnia sinensis]|uniref:CUB domain-containing protein n=1 Tax=Daphnia sinensis TaxID=1820382 RepID=A0AAD5L293_9CRUS|nr:hypothetical protein GHT06_019939 [Daphnia sinensis]